MRMRCGHSFPLFHVEQTTTERAVMVPTRGKSSTDSAKPNTPYRSCESVSMSISARLVLILNASKCLLHDNLMIVNS